MRRVLPILLLMACVACGSDPSPVAPTAAPPFNVAGNWTGTRPFTTIRRSNVTNNGLLTIVMSLTQAGSAVSGTWSIQAANGTVSGTTTNTGQFSGTFTFNAQTVNG